jgi:flagellin-like protein
MTRNERTLPNRDERGQVGIGTLIVFIAMVLVAAIAAGVLINTAGFLQSKGEATGQESTSQVVNRLEITSVTGIVSSGEIEKVKMTVTQAPGAENIDLEQVTVQWVGPSGSHDIVHSSLSGDATFSVEKFKDSDDSSPVVNDPDDRLVMKFDLTAAGASYSKLGGGDTVRVQMSPASGTVTTTTLVVPESLEGENAVTL